jgi:hypothetical protein
MTEAEWLKSGEPFEMFCSLGGNATDRKLRLFQVACCRRIWDHLPDKVCRAALSVAENYADGEVKDKERREAHTQASKLIGVGGLIASGAAAAVVYANEKKVSKKLIRLGVSSVLAQVARKASKPTARDPWTKVHRAEERFAARLVHSIFGNPFRPVTFSPDWLTSTVVALAWQMYESRDFSPMPILADALQDAGCDSDDILDHCRGETIHVRGCWVVDLVLGKE